MNIPAIISKNTLGSMGENDTHAVRVILHDVHNPSACRVRCRTRQYLFERCGVVMAHVLDIPISVWMAGVGNGRFRDNRAVCDDWREVRQKFTVQVIPWKGSAAIDDRGNLLAELRRLLLALDAPEDVERAFDIIENGANAEDLAAFVDGVIGHLGSDAPPPEVPQAPAPAATEETPAQARARKMREAKAAKKSQLQTA